MRPVEKLKSEHPQAVVLVEDFRGQTTVVVSATEIRKVLEFLRDDPECRFDFLVDITCADYLRWQKEAAKPTPSAPKPTESALKPQAPPERFAVVYHLCSLALKHRLRVKSFVPEREPRIASAAALWPAANWAEREAYDMFGIHFEDHPDLRRILMPDDYEGYPLRKDYPLRGHGERESFPVVTPEEEKPTFEV